MDVYLGRHNKWSSLIGDISQKIDKPEYIIAHENFNFTSAVSSNSLA